MVIVKWPAECHVGGCGFASERVQQREMIHELTLSCALDAPYKSYEKRYSAVDFVPKKRFSTGT
jgi:hypothetical protein